MRTPCAKERMPVNVGLPEPELVILEALRILRARFKEQNRMIEYEKLFRGTLTQTSVYPREVVKQALAMNAAAVILHHNHPSGLCQPSRADEALTQTLKVALALVDVRVLDHIITSDEGALSMAERGLV